MKTPKVRIPYEHTTICPERTQSDIVLLLKGYGIDDKGWVTYKGRTILQFIWKVNVKGVDKEIMFRFEPPMIETQRRVWSGKDQRTVRATVQLEATSYRLLWHYLKNKLEAVRWGLESMEKEFLSHAVVSLPNGQSTTVGERIQDVLETVGSPALTYESSVKDESKIFETEKVQVHE